MSAVAAVWHQSDPQQMHGRLLAWARSLHGPRAQVDDVARMPGHSGITFGFDVVDSAGVRERLVLRVPPIGVRRHGVTDVLRQVPLLRVLAAHGVPVPRVRWSGADEQWFGTPYLIVDRVAGATPGDVFAHAGLPAAARADRDALFDQAMDALARVHAVDTGALPTGWSTPHELPDLIDHWLRLLERTEWPELVRAGRTVHTRLHATVPRRVEAPGLVHGDFYQNNWMVDGGRLTAVLDWESAHLGPAPIDVGYVAMMYDPQSWDGAMRTDLVDADRPERLLDRYEHACGRPLARPDWFRSLAGLRLATLTAHFLRLHRTGRRPDPTWETVATSAPPMLERAAELVDR